MKWFITAFVVGVLLIIFGSFADSGPHLHDINARPSVVDSLKSLSEVAGYIVSIISAAGIVIKLFKGSSDPPPKETSQAVPIDDVLEDVDIYIDRETGNVDVEDPDTQQVIKKGWIERGRIRWQLRRKR
ncbi:MAG: hypothetical protein K2W86_18095 [Sphingomonas sp.]|uniref:hypothetical protein n=1 Tax=Sphingomonas sp. TaxID=28214 RepID=UPI0035A98BC5|nr:hypothetical protein [Sphingomonas sp.]